MSEPTELAPESHRGGAPGSRLSPGTYTLALAVFAVTLAVVALASAIGAAGMAAFQHTTGAGEAGAHKPGDLESMAGGGLALYLVLFQGAVVVLTLFAARLFKASGLRFFPLAWPRRGWLVILSSIAGLLALASFGGMIVYYFDRSTFEADMRPFADLARSRALWVLFAAAAIGAPIAEELLFRGFLFTGLRATPLGFAGAAGVSSLLWAMMHANYSSYGILLVLAIGLLLAYVRDRTGSLIPAIACHAVYNGIVVLALAFAPESALSQGGP